MHLMFNKPEGRNFPFQYLVMRSICVLVMAGAVWFAREPSKTVAAQTQSDRFVDSGDGTVTDTQTGLMWAAEDNGSGITWDDARRYCEECRGGGYLDWRMPTIDELRSLYDKSYSRAPECCSDCDPIHITPLVDLSCYGVWSSELEGSLHARAFGFRTGHDPCFGRSNTDGIRALPVRSVRR